MLGKNYEIICQNIKYKNISEFILMLKKLVENNTDFVLTSELNEFRLSKRLYIRNSFNPIFVGEIFQYEDYLKINGKFSYYNGTIIALGIIYTFLFLFTIISISTNGFAAIISLGFLCFAFSLQWLGTKITKELREEIITFIGTACR